jgi:hypothetical protein
MAIHTLSLAEALPAGTAGLPGHGEGPLWQISQDAHNLRVPGFAKSPRQVTEDLKLMLEPDDAEDHDHR